MTAPTTPPVPTMFIPPGEKISIGSLDETEIHVDAQYNPKELQIDKTIAWQKHNKANANGLQLEFTGAEGRTMSIDLLFDGYEEHISIQPKVAVLEKLATVREPNSKHDEMRRPHHCVVVWGTVMGGSENSFKCVIDSIQTKYTMFSSAGVPLRATVTLKLKEAERLTLADGLQTKGKPGGKAGDKAGGGTSTGSKT